MYMYIYMSTSNESFKDRLPSNEAQDYICGVKFLDGLLSCDIVICNANNCWILLNLDCRNMYNAIVASQQQHYSKHNRSTVLLQKVETPVVSLGLKDDCRLRLQTGKCRVLGSKD